ncbi:MAG: hypothetical protein HYS46_00150 [Betaproteobacteria bacterium]|nr:hypothetical protein [Betaproteobacteria bacterium]
MEIRPIKTRRDYQAALREVERLWNAPEGSVDADRLDRCYLTYTMNPREDRVTVERTPGKRRLAVTPSELY